MLGYPLDELLGKVGLDLLVQEKDRDAQWERLRRRSQGISEQYEVQFKKKSGELIWV